MLNNTLPSIPSNPIDTLVMISAIIAGWITQKKPFTAYSVYQEMRQQGFSSRYNDTKSDIHKEANRQIVIAGYLTASVDSPTGKTILYFFPHPGYDPNSFFAGNITHVG